MWRFLSLVFLFTVAACTETAIGALDEKVSGWTNRECSTMFVVLGDDYCRDRRVAGERQAEKIHCFRTLGGVDCYADPDPYAINPSGRVRQTTRLTQPEPAIGQPAQPVPAEEEKTAAAAPVKPVTMAPLVALPGMAPQGGGVMPD